MAYFLPSYFQKRLLRYALTRLDFIETDALNLEDLDITLGQRSIIELKNVGLKVSKLIEQLQIPSSVILNHATVQFLRITIPADLHISGIEVELDGIDVQVELQEDDNTLRRATGSAPGRGDAANRPRIASPNLYDPGGRAATARMDDMDVQHVIPTSQDLAMSFLQSEPPQEREELEAAIQSQSHRLSDSTTSFDGSTNESGIGMPGGFSLPGFVAKFFAGVADRLSVSVKNIAASITMKIHSDGNPIETVKVLVKLAAVSLDGLQSHDDMVHQRSQRSVSIDGFEILLLSEAETFSRTSTTSSPKLSRSRSKMSSTSDEQDMLQFESPEQRMFDFNPSSRPTYTERDNSQTGVSSDGSTSSSQLADLSMDLGDPLLADSSAFSPSTRAPTSSQLYETRNNDREVEISVDNREHAEIVASTSTIPRGSVNIPRNASAGAEDLTTSRMFTHDQAESMYMSAMSEAVGMPGGWETSQYPGTADPDGNALFTSVDRSKSAAADTISPVNERLPSPPKFQQAQKVLASDSPSKQTHPISTSPSMLNLVAKQLVLIDHFTVSFPSSISKSDTIQPEAQIQSYGNKHTASSPPRSTSYSGRVASSIQESRYDPTSSGTMQAGHTRASSRDFFVSADYEYAVSVGSISINLDMSIGRVLIATVSQVNRYLPPPPPPSKDRSEKATQPQLSSIVTLDHLSVNICQHVPEIPAREIQTGSETHGSSSFMETCLLQLRLSKLKHELAMTNQVKRQRLVVEKIVLGHSSQKYLYFVDSLGMRDSVATSMMIRPNDLVVTNVDDRFDVQIKPIHAVIDLLKVDEVLSRSGGLSSILDLGASIMSTGTVTESPPKSKPPSTRQRAVRFDSKSDEPASSNETTLPGFKIDVRISGVVVDLIGSESSVQIRSSAIKMVSRTGSFRAQIDVVLLAGPVLGRSQTRPGINIKITNVTVHFKESPEEDDLDRLLSLLTPSGNKYDEEDDIMVDTLIRQRRKGAVLRLSVNEVKVDVSGVAWLKHVTRLGDELSKLATVTKYLPEDDRPGMLTFGLITKVAVNVDFGRTFGVLHLSGDLVEGAIISVPSLMAAQISDFSLRRGEDVLFGDVIPSTQDQPLMRPPMLMCRFIADEMEPTIRMKLSNACFEYKVPTLVAITKLVESLNTGNTQAESVNSEKSSETPGSPSDKSDFARKVQVSLAFRDCAIALNPGTSARGLALLSDAVLTHSSRKQTSKVQLDLRKASILIIDDVAKLGLDTTNADHKLYFEENDQVQELTKAGYVPVGSISNASAIITLTEDKSTNTPLIDVEFRNNLFLLESCADSTQTLIQILSNLAPPSPPSATAKYRTEIVPIEDMLASFTGNAFVTEPGPELGLQASRISTTTSTTNTEDYDDDDESDDDDDTDDESEAGLHNIYHEDDDEDDRMTESYLESELSQSRMTNSIHVAPVNPTASPDPPMDQSVMMHSMLDFRDEHFIHKPSVGGTAHRWNSSENTYGLGSESRAQESPLKVRVRDVHIIWNLFDGYDWQNTRDTISQAVKDIETKAMARKPRRRDSRLSPSAEEDESVIGDFLFNSIYIGIPANKDPRELANAINQDIGDMTSETGSYATGTTVTATPSGRATSSRSKTKKLRLSRSRQHKMTFELKGVSADVIVFPPGSGEIESSIDVRVKMLEIFDHVPTSTWKKFATYMHEAGEREVDTSMVHLELLNVKPVAELAASEIILKLTVLPLRLHVDQDALDFLTRFFEFKDERAPVSDSPSAPPFLQRAEVNPIRLRLDFKPKRVDYGGLRSGRTTEFMNFFVLDRADMVLRRVILYGVSGFDRLGIMLNSIWSPDVRKNQLPTVLAGLAPIRSLVDVGSGVKDLIAVPIREYKKDGRIVRSIQKGAVAFAKTTTTELVNLGAKLAIGTQTVLQNAEDVLVPKSKNEEDEEEKEQISLYADQPIGIVQGLRGAYASLERDLLLAKDAIVAVPGEVMASGSAAGAARAIIRQSPTIILRPAIGATKAVGQTLLGAGNTLDKGNLRRVENKYKHR